MGLGCEVNNRSWPIFSEDVRDEFVIADIAMDEAIPVAVRGTQVLWIAGVGESVKINYRSWMPREPMENEIGADEPGTSSNKEWSMHVPGDVLGAAGFAAYSK